MDRRSTPARRSGRSSTRSAGPASGATARPRSWPGRFSSGSGSTSPAIGAQQNLDGGLYYTPAPDGRHNSYGLCTSVVGCAVLYWVDLWGRTGEERYLDGIGRGVGFILAAQFADDDFDQDARGAFFEAPHPPDGSLSPGHQIRDIATIFAIRALDAVLDVPDLVDAGRDWADTSMAW